jgi:hypothetical protein
MVGLLRQAVSPSFGQALCGHLENKTTDMVLTNATVSLRIKDEVYFPADQRRSLPAFL